MGYRGMFFSTLQDSVSKMQDFISRIQDCVSGMQDFVSTMQDFLLLCGGQAGACRTNPLRGLPAMRPACNRRPPGAFSHTLLDKRKSPPKQKNDTRKTYQTRSFLILLSEG